MKWKEEEYKYNHSNFHTAVKKVNIMEYTTKCKYIALICGLIGIAAMAIPGIIMLVTI